MVFAALLLAALPGGALAWTATLDAGHLLITDTSGRDDALVLEDDGTNLRVASEAAVGFEGALPLGCVAQNGDLLCPAVSLVAVEVHAGDGDDQIENTSAATQFAAFGENGDDELIGGSASDTLDAGAGEDRLTGGLGDDRLTGGVGTDELSGGAGDDQLDGGDGADLLGGGAGVDMLRGSADGDTLVGGSANDVLDGGAASDVLDGGPGDDSLDGADGDDLLQSAEGSDTLHGGIGNDRLLVTGLDATTLNGGEGDDTLQGGDGNDQLDGGAGTDRLDGGEGADALAGGDGSDTADYSQRVVPVTVTVGTGADDGIEGERDDVHGEVERVLGGVGNDLLVAGARSAQLVGGIGDDTLRGGAAGDVLDGGEDDDRIQARSASPDRDAVRCGVGSDRFEVDRSDSVAVDCEGGRVDGAVVDTGSQLRFGPSIRLSAPTFRVVRANRNGRFALDLACGVHTIGSCGVALSVRARLGRHVLRVAAARVRLASGATRSVRLQLRRSTLRMLRRAERRGFSGEIVVALADGRGQTSTRRIRLRVLLAAAHARHTRTKTRGRA